MKTTEGKMPFLGYETYYRIAEPDQSSSKLPLVLLHGGPGSTHNYMEAFDCLADERMVISYDQIGCGNSYLDGHPELWKAETWVNELKCLFEYLNLEKVFLLGQSWGGMLEQLYCLQEGTEKVQAMVLSSTLSSASLYAEEQLEKIRKLPEQYREPILNAISKNEFTDPEYIAANDYYMQKYCSGPFSEDSPEYLLRKKKSGQEAYLTAWGPNEYIPSGTLKDYEITDQLGKIDIPVLIISGDSDLVGIRTAQAMENAYPNAKRIFFNGSRHMCFIDCQKEYMRMLRNWLNEKEYEDEI